MNRERLLVVWEVDRGVRAGFAFFQSTPHYFEQVWDGYDYGHALCLKPVSLEVIAMAREARRIMEDWEKRRAEGMEDMTSRPDLPGTHPRYWRLREKIEEVLRSTPRIRAAVRGRVMVPDPGSGDGSREQSEAELFLEWHDGLLH